MAVNTITHGTRQGYRKGCRNRNTCPGGPDGTTCTDAANAYNRELRQAHADTRARRKPVRAGTKPRSGGYRVLSGSPRSEPRSASTGPDTPGSWPSPDEAVYDPPESLVNAIVEGDPEPADSDNDFYNDPEFIVTPKIRADIEGKLGLFAAIIGMPLEAIDPYCGPVFANNCDNMIKALVPIISRSPRAVKFMTSTSGGWLDWINFIRAAAPVGMAVYAHHLARTVNRDNRPVPDATMPPGGDNYQYSAA